MIYALLANGPSTLPLFVPLLPQALLLFLLLRQLRRSPVRFLPPSTIVVSAVIFALAIIGAFTSDLQSALKYSKLVLNSVTAVALGAALLFRYGDRFSAAYSSAVLLACLAGIGGLILNAMTGWSLSANIGDRAYHTNLLTVWLFDAGFNSSATNFSPFEYRLQSWFDEPGTFGILLLPALFFYLRSGDWLRCTLILFGIFLSESANAWAITVLLGLWKIFSLRSNVAMAVWLGVIAILAGLAAPDIIRLYEIKTGIDEAYANSSSLMTRSTEYDYLFENLATHALPLSQQFKAASQLEGISSSYVAWYVAAGLLFVLCICSVVFELGFRAVRSIGIARGDVSFALVMAAVVFLSGFQRTSFLDNVLFMSLMYWSLFYLKATTMRRAR